MAEIPAKNIGTLGAWLDSHGLCRIEPILARNAIGLDVLAALNNDDLREIGLPLGDRKRLLAAIESLGGVDGLQPGGEGERRQCTVLFCDVVGYTELSRKLDPEDLEALIAAFMARCERAVADWGGHVANYLGDGLLAWFGWPTAHEDAADRAVRAALAMAAEDGDGLRCRVGVATGLVLIGRRIGSGAALTETAFGATMCLAARLEQLAEPGQVVAAEATRTLLSGAFALRDQGVRRLRGYAEPAQVWLVEGLAAEPTRGRSRREVAEGAPLGREDALDTLSASWREVVETKSARFVLVTGEAGVGKTRLLRHFTREVANPATTVSLTCWPHTRDTTLAPVIERLHRTAACAVTDPPEKRRDAIATLWTSLGLDATEMLNDLGGLLSLGGAGNDVSPQLRRRRWLDRLVDMVRVQATLAPLIIEVEDAHLLDPVTRELLEAVLLRLRDSPVLLVVALRAAEATPFAQGPWSDLQRGRLVPLRRLDAAMARALVARIAPEGALADEMIERIVVASDGVPLFLEELAYSVLGRQGLGDGAEGGAIDIPITLHDVLIAQLDATGPAKRLAQTASCIGRVFSAALIAETTGVGGEALTGQLRLLEEAAILVCDRPSSEPTWRFRHALIHEAAYQSLLKSRRRIIHAALAKALEARERSGREVDPAVVAHQFEAAGAARPAALRWLQAGERAAGRAADHEAIGCYRRALSLLDDLAADDGADGEAAADDIRLRLNILLGDSLASAEGYGVPEALAAYDRAALLARATGDDLCIAAWRGQWMHAHMSADYIRAEAVARVMADFAARKGRAELRYEAARALGATAFVTGRLHEARSELMIAAASGVTDDARLAALSYLGRALWFIGEPEQSLRCCTEAVEGARSIGHAFGLARALVFLGHSRQLRGEAVAVIEAAREVVEVSDRHVFPFFAGVGRMLWGWAAVMQGDHASGAALMDEGFTIYTRTHSAMSRPWFQMLRAEAALRSGDAAGALARVEDALRFAERSGERLVTPECLRVGADALASLGRVAEARSHYGRAVLEATEIGATACAHRARDALDRLECADRLRMPVAAGQSVEAGAA